MSGKPIRVRISGDVHNPRSVQVTDATTGEPISNVLEVNIHIGGVPGDNRVTLTLWGAELDLTGTVQPQVKDGELVTSEVKLE